MRGPVLTREIVTIISDGGKSSVRSSGANTVELVKYAELTHKRAKDGTLPLYLARYLMVSSYRSEGPKVNGVPCIKGNHILDLMAHDPTDQAKLPLDPPYVVLFSRLHETLFSWRQSFRKGSSWTQSRPSKTVSQRNLLGIKSSIQLLPFFAAFRNSWLVVDYSRISI